VRLATLGLAIAYGAFGLTFRGPKTRFWQRMTNTGALLGTLAIAGDASLQRPQLRRRDVALRLAAVVGPAEELFWRGLVQRTAVRRLGLVPGVALSAGAYGGAHLVTGNPALIGAATVAGIYWSIWAALGAPMAALITSHVVWDIWIFLLAPTQPVTDRSA